MVQEKCVSSSLIDCVAGISRTVSAGKHCFFDVLEGVGWTTLAVPEVLLKCIVLTKKMP